MSIQCKKAYIDRTWLFNQILIEFGVTERILVEFSVNEHILIEFSVKKHILMKFCINLHSSIAKERIVIKYTDRAYYTKYHVI